jgi:hypothetical protein
MRWAARIRTRPSYVSKLTQLLVGGVFIALSTGSAHADGPSAPTSKDARVTVMTPRSPAGEAGREMVPEAQPSPDGAFDYETSRYEPAGFPLIGGSSDIGVEVGAVGTLSKFGYGIRPYQWNMDALVAVSAKSGPRGLEVTQQNYLWTIDAPGLDGRSLRLIPAVAYTSTINMGYFGLGNASSGHPPATLSGAKGRYFQYVDRVAIARVVARVKVRPPFDAVVTANYRFEDPSAYAGSRLDNDAHSHRIRGLEPVNLITLGTGFIYDTRDNEYFPRRGAFHQVGVRFVEGIPNTARVDYAAFGAVLAAYRSFGPVVAAGRVLVDAQVGNVPFYDLFTGEPFIQYAIIGGSGGIRGVPVGRYLGRLKALGNVELRTMFWDFRILSQPFHLGAATFVDTGRVWSDYTFASRDDGRGVGLKWGVGAGFLIRWGQAAVFRIEAAYSPDAVAENPNFPIGLYVQDGVMF